MSDADHSVLGISSLLTFTLTNWAPFRQDASNKRERMGRLPGSRGLRPEE